MSAFIIALAKMLASVISAGLLYQGFAPSSHGALLTKIAGVIVSLCTVVAVIPDVIDFFKPDDEASQTEQKFWDGVLKYREAHKNNAMDCAYLKKYPEGQFVVLAKGECPEKMADSTPAPVADEAAPPPTPESATDAAAPAPAVETRQAFEPEMVQLPNGKWMGKYEVTIGEYMVCVKDGGCKNPEWLEEGNEYNITTGKNKDYYSTRGMSLENKRYPITGVSWNDTQSYIAWLNGKTNKTYRLPTEEEWFEACQAGASPATTYCGSDNLDKVAWYQENSSNTTHSVGGRDENLWHLHNMSGNVWEWTDSFYDETKSQRVLRGGSWGSSPSGLRSAHRYFYAPDTRDGDLGFRLSRM